MMGHREKLICGGEWDALSWRAKKILKFNSGTRKYWKNKVNRRNRRVPNLIAWAEDEFYNDELTNAEIDDYFYAYEDEFDWWYLRIRTGN